jgi:hypothetical protein
MLFATNLAIPRTTLTSRIAPGTFGPGKPPGPLTGTTGGNDGIFALPTFALVYQPEDSGVTYGVGFFQPGGFGVNYPVSRTNPILSPQFPHGRGLGNLDTQYAIYQLAPTVAMRVTDQLSLGFAANLDLASLTVNPALFSTPALLTTLEGTGLVYPSAYNGRARWGEGSTSGLTTS